MDEPRAERYTTDDVMRATEPVVAPVAPGPVPERTYEERTYATPTTAPRPVDERPVAPVPETRTRAVVDDERRRGFSFLDSFLGWNIAAFWMLVFTGIALAILGSAAYNANATTTTANGFTVPDLANLAAGGIIGLVVAQFLAYFIGGYGAGRMARGSGLANGLGVAVWGVVIAIVLGLVAAGLTNAYNAGYWLSYYGVNLRNLTGPAIGTLVGSLIAMFLGGILGGILGARPYERRVYETREERDRYYRRGRPL